MGVIVVLGEATRVEGFALAGAIVIPADDPDAVRRACRSLPEDTSVVVLTEKAAVSLGDGAVPRGVLTTVMPR